MKECTYQSRLLWIRLPCLLMSHTTPSYVPSETPLNRFELKTMLDIEIEMAITMLQHHLLRIAIKKERSSLK